MGRYLNLARNVANERFRHNGPLNREIENNEPSAGTHSQQSASTKETKYTKEDLDVSQARLEAAGVNVAIWPDGRMRVVVTEDETLKAIDDGGTVYSPEDMLHYVELEPHERRLLHQFKKRFGGTVEWRMHSKEPESGESAGSQLSHRRNG